MGRKGTHSTPFTWAEAERLAGSEDRLIHGVNEKTWRGWRETDNVPAYRLLALIKEQVARPDPQAAPLARAHRLLDSLWRRTRGSGRDWTLIETVLAIEDVPASGRRSAIPVKK
jgi:hypothetical protein